MAEAGGVNRKNAIELLLQIPVPVPRQLWMRTGRCLFELANVANRIAESSGKSPPSKRHSAIATASMGSLEPKQYADGYAVRCNREEWGRIKSDLCDLSKGKNPFRPPPDAPATMAGRRNTLNEYLLHLDGISKGIAAKKVGSYLPAAVCVELYAAALPELADRLADGRDIPTQQIGESLTRLTNAVRPSQEKDLRRLSWLIGKLVATDELPANNKPDVLRKLGLELGELGKLGSVASITSVQREQAREMLVIQEALLRGDQSDPRIQTTFKAAAQTRLAAAQRARKKQLQRLANPPRAGAEPDARAASQTAPTTTIGGRPFRSEIDVPELGSTLSMWAVDGAVAFRRIDLEPSSVRAAGEVSAALMAKCEESDIHAGVLDYVLSLPEEHREPVLTTNWSLYIEPAIEFTIRQLDQARSAEWASPDELSQQAKQFAKVISLIRSDAGSSLLDSWCADREMEGDSIAEKRAEMSDLIQEASDDLLYVAEKMTEGGTKTRYKARRTQSPRLLRHLHTAADLLNVDRTRLTMLPDRIGQAPPRVVDPGIQESARQHGVYLGRSAASRQAGRRAGTRRAAQSRELIKRLHALRPEEDQAERRDILDTLVGILTPYLRTIATDLVTDAGHTDNEDIAAAVGLADGVLTLMSERELRTRREAPDRFETRAKELLLGLWERQSTLNTSFEDDPLKEHDRIAKEFPGHTVEEVLQWPPLQRADVALKIMLAPPTEISTPPATTKEEQTPLGAQQLPTAKADETTTLAGRSRATRLGPGSLRRFWNPKR